MQHDEEADDLGYYPDGVKRTLTDEQISMFRHSEIYSIRRKRQLQKENRDADGDFGNAPEPSDPPPASLEHPLEQYLGMQVRSQDNDSTIHEAENVSKGQKPKKIGEKGRRIEVQSSRRQIRELDGMNTGINYLDYGEDLSISRSGEKLAALDRSSGTQVHSANHEVQQNSQKSEIPKSTTQGKKIWWPTIG